ncbi:MAG: MBL fold metallo-hydrolase [Eubacteriales bacterium]|nr:MBL fold metallo-hydrolase [Eubacteriales bacterium]
MSFYYSIASGSSGNCAVWRAGGTAVLIDLGASVRALNQALRAIDMQVEDVTAVLLTHEHTDHIKGLATFVKKYDLPVYTTFGTAAAILQKLPQAQASLHTFSGGEAFDVGGLHVQSMPISHDAAEPVAYRIDGGGYGLGYVTDTGFLPEQVQAAVSGCDTIVLESNHDVEMLRTGPYPMYLKQRIRGKYGHLSNEECAAGARMLAQAGAKRLVLAHLSDKNNNPLTAFRCTQRSLSGSDCQLYVAPRGAMEEPIPLTEEGMQCSMFA